MTDTTTDGVHGVTHKLARNATKFNSDSTMVKADNNLREHPDFENNKVIAEAEGDSLFNVERPLEDVFGSNYQSQIDGVTRVGSENNPTGSVPTNFGNGGTVKGVYNIAPDGSVGTYTLYPIKAATE